jgi:hypothetical protein
VGNNGEGNVVSVDGRVLPVDCKIHFAVPSNPVLLKETSTYTNDTSHPGLLNVALDAFANENRNYRFLPISHIRYCALSIKLTNIKNKIQSYILCNGVVAYTVK